MRAKLNLKCNAWAISAAVLLIVLFAPSANALLYWENQMVLGYSPSQNKAIYYSSDQREAMQKPSTGFDYLQKYSDEYRDIAVTAIQARLAWNEGTDPKLEPQIYNAYIKLKSGPADAWFGHNREAFGMSAYFDNHAQLLNTLGMEVLGFDRDWGVGLSRDLDWGDLAFSATTGSGMSLYINGNYLLSARASKGVLARDNFNVGFSLAGGRILDTMGVNIIQNTPQDLTLVGIDASYLINNLEFRAEYYGGEKSHIKRSNLFLRESLNLIDESRLKIEAQQVLNDQAATRNYQISFGTTYLVDDKLTLRAMYEYDSASDSSRIVCQMYSYGLAL